MEKTDIILDEISGYLKKHPEIADNIVEEYLTTESYSVDKEAFREIFPAILYSLYDFIRQSDMLTDVMKKNMEELESKNDYTALTEALIHIWTSGAIPLLIQWEDAPEELSRKVLVPVRMNLSDIMYAALSTLRFGLTKPVYLESGDYSFLSGMETPDQEDGSYRASDYPSFTIYGLEHVKLAYGYDNAWVFHVQPSRLRMLDHAKSVLPMVLIDGAGYGIIEDSIDAVKKILKDPEAEENGVKLRDMIGVGLKNAGVEELKTNASESFYMTQYRYEAGTPLMDEDEA